MHDLLSSFNTSTLQSTHCKQLCTGICKYDFLYKYEVFNDVLNTVGETAPLQLAMYRQNFNTLSKHEITRTIHSPLLSPASPDTATSFASLGDACPGKSMAQRLLSAFDAARFAHLSVQVPLEGISSKCAEQIAQLSSNLGGKFSR